MVMLYLSSADKNHVLLYSVVYLCIRYFDDIIFVFEVVRFFLVVIHCWSVRFRL
jgi:hypothetical protein